MASVAETLAKGETPKLIACTSISMGGDPEAFLENEKGDIIGSELIIPKEGLHGITGSSVVRDGVQLELHYSARHCRQEYGEKVSKALNLIREELKKHPGVKFCFKGVVRVKKKELMRLSEDSRRLGCAPSENIYDEAAELGVNPETYPYRSAGGHIHVGVNTKLKAEYKRIVRMMDIMLGNQCVLLDRDPKQRLRRRVYGRAGECRQNKYGLEYRTLSNFWLRSAPLLSFVLAQARTAVHIISMTDGIGDYNYGKWDFEKAVFDTGIKISDVIKAINKNDFDLAMKNFEKLIPFFKVHTAPGWNGLNLDNVDNFKRFAEGINKKGIENWFPKDPLEYWPVGSATYYGGFESFISGV